METLAGALIPASDLSHGLHLTSTDESAFQTHWI